MILVTPCCACLLWEESFSVSGFTSAALRVLHPSPLHLTRNNYVVLLYMITSTALQELLWRARSYHCFVKLHIRAGSSPFHQGSLLRAESFKIFSTFVLLLLEINTKMFDQLQKKSQCEKSCHLPSERETGQRVQWNVPECRSRTQCLQRAVGAVPCLTCLQGSAARATVRQKALSSHGPTRHISWEMSFGRRGKAFPSSFFLLGTAETSQRQQTLNGNWTEAVCIGNMLHFQSNN